MLTTRRFIFCLIPATKTLRLISSKAASKTSKAWAVQNKMKFNDAKTEIMHFHSRFVARNPPSTLTIGDSLVDITHEARNLGILFEDTLSMEKHIVNLCRAGWACIRRIRKLCKYLDEAATEKLAHAFIEGRDVLF